MNWSDFRKPINITFLAIGVISLMITLIIYLVSRREAQLSYYTVTIQIVDQNETRPFSVLDNGGSTVKGNIYATDITVWNSGNLPLEPTNVRRPLHVSLSGSDTRLIDASLPYETSDNISEFRLEVDFFPVTQNSTKLNSNGVAQINWRYFDPGEGFRLKLIYASKEMQTVMLSRVIFGVQNFDNKTPPPRGTLSLASPGFQQLVIVILLVLTATGLQIMNIVTTRLRTVREQQRTEVKKEDGASRTQRYSRYVPMGLIILSGLFQIWAFSTLLNR